MNIYKKEKDKAIAYLFFRYILALKAQLFPTPKDIK